LPIGATAGTQQFQIQNRSPGLRFTPGALCCGPARVVVEFGIFINQVLRREQRRIFLEDLAAAYREQSADPEFQAEFELWNVTLADGLNSDS
jgi:hypothetical protein